MKNKIKGNQGHKKYTVQQLLDAIEGSNGVVLNVSKKLKCNWMTAKTYIEKYPETIQAFYDESEKALDKAENTLHKLIKEDDPGMVKYMLSTKGRKRGYGEKKEIEHSGELEQNVTVNIAPMAIDAD